MINTYISRKKSDQKKRKKEKENFKEIKNHRQTKELLKCLLGGNFVNRS